MTKTLLLKEVRALLYMRGRGDITFCEFYRLLGHHAVAPRRFVLAYLSYLFYWRLLPALVGLALAGAWAYLHWRKP